MTRQSKSSPYFFGFGMVVLVASWNGFRIPIRVATIDPERKGHQNMLFRQMLRDFEPPSWVREMVVLGDAAYPANATLKLIEKLGWTYVFAMPRTRKFTNGKYLRNLVQHLPKSLYRRRATYKPDGKRQDYWVFMRHAELHQLGDVTIVLSKKRRTLGPNRVKIIVTNRLDVSASDVISQYAVRWQVGVSREGHMHPVGESPTEVRSSSLVAWEAPWRETKTVEPSDTMLFWSMRKTPGCNVQ